MPDLTDEEVQAILLDRDSNCDPARALRKVLDLLVEANLQGENEDTFSVEREEEAAEAVGALAKIATALIKKDREPG